MRISAGRSLRGNVDRNLVRSASLYPFPSRSLRGNVDRNDLDVETDMYVEIVVPYVGGVSIKSGQEE